MALLLDTYTSATVAYGLTKLRAAYAGSCIRVRRSNDDAEADIGFSTNLLDTTALAAHVGANSGYIVKWYDQSGNGIDLAGTSTAQPRIVNSGTVDNIGGISAIYFDGSNDRIASAASVANGLPITIAFAWAPLNLTQSNKYIGALGANRFALLWEYDNNKVELYSTGPDTRTGSQITMPNTSKHHVVYAYANGAQTSWLDGTRVLNATAGMTYASANSSLYVGGSDVA